MFGYIKPFVPDLRVREHELYRAVYCGLCRSMGRHTGCASRLTLSYDFAFLAAFRLALEPLPDANVRVTRCAASPLKKRPIMDDNPVLAYCASAAAILTREKVRDDLCDSKGAERMKARLLWPAAVKMAKKAKKQGFDIPEDEITKCLGNLVALEKENCPLVDRCADCFGELLSLVFSQGLSDNDKIAAKAFGRSIGRIIYVLDAADDMEKDKKSGAFNPLNLESIPPEALSASVRIELSKAVSALNLLDMQGMIEARELVYNVIYEGLPKEADRIFNKSQSRKAESHV